MPKVSIILTTHGQAPYLKQAIGSVLAQTFEDWECIVATDGPYDIARDAISDSRLRYWYFDDIPDVPCRFARSINSAFQYAKGDFITYLCHDDLYLPWRLEMMVRYFKTAPLGAADVCFGWQRLMDEVNGEMHLAGEGFTRQGNPEQPAGTVDHSSVMHRRECFEKAGGWDEEAPMRYGDAYFWARLQAAGYKFHCIPEVLDAHRFNPHSVSWKEDHPS